MVTALPEDNAMFDYRFHTAILQHEARLRRTQLPPLGLRPIRHPRSERPRPRKRA
jgi:hypothetical protein